jgi:hypothetical protein
LREARRLSYAEAKSARNSSAGKWCWRTATMWNTPRSESAPIFSFYMGKNTPERKDYIMDKLVVPVEE